MTTHEKRFERARDIYKSLVSMPKVERAVFCGVEPDLSLDLMYSELSIARSKISHSRQLLHLSGFSTHRAKATSLISPHSEYTAHSPNGLWDVNFISEPDKGKFLEVWTDGAKWGEVEVGETHGEWFLDGSVGLPSFSSDGLKLVYVANLPDSKLCDSDYIPSFGEGYRQLTAPAIVVLDIAKLTASTLITSPIQVQDEDVYVLYPSIIDWKENTAKLAVIGWRRLGDGNQLGMAWCTNRPSSIYLVDVSLPSCEVEVLQISGRDEAARSPRVNNSHELVYLCNRTTAPHDSCAQLRLYNLVTGVNRILVDEITSPEPGDFPGIYSHQLPGQPFLSIGNERYVALSTAWGCREACVMVNLRSGNVVDLATIVTSYSSFDPRASWELLCTNGTDTVVIAVSTPTTPRSLVAIELEGPLTVKSCTIVEQPRITKGVQEALSTLDFDISSVSTQDLMESLVTSPCKMSFLKELSPPVIILPHGGPHGHDTTVFQALRVAYALSGYLVLQPNYYGSTGYGQEYINRLLPPALSVQEVETTMSAVSTVRDLGVRWAKGKRFVVGSSHGGYIAAWVSGRYPDAIDAVVMMNPTIHYPAMIHSTDIPDVITISSGLPFPYENPPVTQTPEEYAKAFACSPISVVDKAITPTLLLIGAEDGRVSPEQGRMWYHGLKKNGVDAKMKVYKGERHSLSQTVPGVLGIFEEALAWLGKYTSWEE